MKEKLLKESEVLKCIDDLIEKGDSILEDFRDDTAMALRWQLKKDAFNLAKIDISKLPDAEPEMSEFCTDCKEYDQEKHCCHRFSQVIATAVKEVKENNSIIHCRDCKNLEIDSIFHDCWCNGHKVWFDHYCGYAERRVDG